MPEYLLNAKSKQSFRVDVPVEANDALREHIRLILLKRCGKGLSPPSPSPYDRASDLDGTPVKVMVSMELVVMYIRISLTIPIGCETPSRREH